MNSDRLLTLAQNPRVWAAVVAVVVVLAVLRRLFSRPPSSGHLTTSRCQSCGWTGQVSKFKPVCPQCAKPIQL
jgi:hypothetical protein